MEKVSNRKIGNIVDFNKVKEVLKSIVVYDIPINYRGSIPEFDLSKYEEEVVKVLAKTFRTEEDVKCLFEKHFEAAYALNKYFYSNYKTDTAIKNLLANSMSEYDSECSVDLIGNLIIALGFSSLDIRKMIVERMVKNVWEWLNQLSESDFEDAVGVDLVPSAKQLKGIAEPLFTSVSQFYVVNEADMDDIIDNFYFQNVSDFLKACWKFNIKIFNYKAFISEQKCNPNWQTNPVPMLIHNSYKEKVQELTDEYIICTEDGTPYLYTYTVEDTPHTANIYWLNEPKLVL